MVRHPIEASWGHQRKRRPNPLEFSQSNFVQNVILFLNSGKAPLDDITVCRRPFMSLTRTALWKKNWAVSKIFVDYVFPLDTPYCDVYLTPPSDYDDEKAVLLSCAGQAKEKEPSGSDAGGSSSSSSTEDTDDVSASSSEQGSQVNSQTIAIGISWVSL